MPVYDYKCREHGLFHKLGTVEEAAQPPWLCLSHVRPKTRAPTDSRGGSGACGSADHARRRGRCVIQRLIHLIEAN